MVVDAFSYNGEVDILELRLKMLDKEVDQFVIVEANYTFSGHEKPLYYEQQNERFAPWANKIRYHVVGNDYTSEEVEQARISPYTDGHHRWMLEFLQKEDIHKALSHLNDDDICYIGDVDELWEPRQPHGIEKLKLHVYSYYLNMASDEEFWGPIRCQYKDIKDKCLNDVRNDLSYRTQDFQGWHFTNQGGIEAVNKKVVDQYNAEVFNSTLIQDHLAERFGKEDYIGRSFKLKIDETQWPQYLKKSVGEYQHLTYPQDMEDNTSEAEVKPIKTL